MECLWFCFSGLIKQDLYRVKEHCNSHYIRESHHDTDPMNCFTYVNCLVLRIYLLLSVHSSVTLSQKIYTFPLQRAKMNTRSIVTMPFELQDFQTPKTGGKLYICTTTFIAMPPVDFFSVRHTCCSSDLFWIASKIGHQVCFQMIHSVSNLNYT